MKEDLVVVDPTKKGHIVKSKMKRKMRPQVAYSPPKHFGREERDREGERGRGNKKR